MNDEERKRIQFEVRNPQAAAYSKIIDEKDAEIGRLKALADIVPEMLAFLCDYDESVPEHQDAVEELINDYPFLSDWINKARELTEAK